jgi:predicted unusual protein kinase regulating ubiquinone biosynthesis (AarF/ABC1/UbiB family)
MGAGVATGVLAEGARQWSKGNRPKMSDLILTPANARKVAKQLSTMRGAAMKVGQLLSMESNDLLPKELATILAQLRDSALTMPRSQLVDVLEASFGKDWYAQFEAFDYAPLASASIGQVHRATTLGGDDIVLKVQYPGIRQSINSDVDNIASLLRITNLLPAHIDISTLLNDAKQQLHDEADYLIEAQYLQRFENAFADWEDVRVPSLYPDLTTSNVLAMSYAPGIAIEDVLDQQGIDADNIMTTLFTIVLHELFELNLMQTDGNFANFRYNVEEQAVVLLDFGAAREFKPQFVEDYRRLLIATAANDDVAIINAADRLGYQASTASQEYQDLVLTIFKLVFEPFTQTSIYDFEKGNLSQRLSELGDQAYDFKRYWQTPPTDILYLHRKLGGMYLLAARLKAKVNCHELLSVWV